jgi:hypothetical protein
MMELVTVALQGQVFAALTSTMG